MKKLPLLLITLSILGINRCHAATLRIKNESKQPVWARINDKTKTAQKEATHTSDAKNIESVGKVPKFKKIKPGASTFFDSGLNPIKKVTFLKVKGHESVKLPKIKLISLLKPLSQKYGNIYAYKWYKHYYSSKYGSGHYYSSEKTDEPVLFFVNRFARTADQQKGMMLPDKPQTTPYPAFNQEITFNKPIFETFTIHPNIGTFIVEKRIVYKGWKNAKVIK